jgi:flagellar hook-basal body complex protein FliE
MNTMISNGISPLLNNKNVDAISPLSVLKTGPQQEMEPNSMMDVSFEKYLAQALEPVNNLQLEAADLDSKLAAGKLEYVHQAMVTAEKASLAMDLTIQVRNKVIEAYQEIMRTQL